MKATIPEVKPLLGRPFAPSVFTLLALALVCSGLAHVAQAVSPPPDGAYPGGNTAEGQSALLSLTTGGFNTAVGLLSLRSDSTTGFNTAIGAGTLLANTAEQNTAIGAGTMLSTTTGGFNTATGAFALFSNTTGAGNVANGQNALFDNTTGGGNTATGAFALRNNTTGGGNTAVGNGALLGNTTGFSNTALGLTAGSLITTASGVIAIGTSAANVSNSCFIGQIRGVTTANADAIPVLIDSAGQLGTMSSSRRYKEEIQPIDTVSEAILALKPVTFYYKTDNTKTPQFGLIAEEVAEVNPDLIVRDKNREIYTVRYDAVNAMLLNEFLKEHRKNQAQQRKIEEQDLAINQLKSMLAQQQKRFESKLAQQEQQIAALVTDLQRLAADVEVNKAEVRTVAEK